VEYINDIEIREEGGTPDIIGSIRAGLVFQLKDAVGYQIIEKREDELVEKFFKRLSKIPSLIILGSQGVSRLAIFSFLIYVPMLKKYLHYNFICSLLNDLFGIQVRSGCACAGPYVLVKNKNSFSIFSISLSFRIYWVLLIKQHKFTPCFYQKILSKMNYFY
jgi:selenocysteine lyase/cysteine desulfurase